MDKHANDEVLKGGLKAHADYYRAPEELRLAIQHRIHAQSPASSSRFGFMRHFGMPQRTFGFGLAFLAGVVATLLGVLFIVPKAGHDDALIALTSDHARALVTGTEIDVVSSDRHTVKPWISRELGVSPAVIDLAQAGYPLRGGRRGYLEGTAVATLVYSYKEHMIDVYALPEAMHANQMSAARSINGFHCLTWRSDGFTMIAISDVDQPRLAEFVRLMQSPPAEPSTE